MAIKYYCDGCGFEIQPASKLNPLQIATIEIVDPSTGKKTDKLLCGICTPKLSAFISTLKLKV